MWNEFWEKVFGSPLLLVVLGALFLLVGAVGDLSVASFRLSVFEIGWRIVLAGVGALLLGIGVWWQRDKWHEGTGDAWRTVGVVKWRNELLASAMATSMDIRMLSTSNYSLLSESFEHFRAFLKRGGQLRCIYTPPDGEAIKMVAMRNSGVESDLAHLRKQYELTIEALRELAQYAPEGAVRVKTIDYPQGIVLTLVDPLSPAGKAFITINGFGKHYTERPCWVLPKKGNEEWFQFFLETFENMWASPHAQPVRFPEKA